MKVVILAGGLGTRISEETTVRPKPMVEIGGKPILWHIMKMYASHGLTEFVVCCGYKGWVIKEYFANYFLRHSDITVDLKSNRLEFHDNSSNTEPWTVNLVDTGELTMTGGRLKRVSDQLGETFCMTYGDGVSDIDISALVKFHQESGRQATLTAVQPAGRFGALELDSFSNQVGRFDEKPLGDGSFVNGGFFVCEPSVLSTVVDDTTVWEQGPLQTLAQDGQLGAFRHTGFWQPMDSLNDKHRLEQMWASGQAPWKRW